MNISKKRLNKIIKEEIEAAISEGWWGKAKSALGLGKNKNKAQRPARPVNPSKLEDDMSEFASDLEFAQRNAIKKDDPQFLENLREKWQNYESDVFIKWMFSDDAKKAFGDDPWDDRKAEKMATELESGKRTKAIENAYKALDSVEWQRAELSRRKTPEYTGGRGHAYGQALE